LNPELRAGPARDGLEDGDDFISLAPLWHLIRRYRHWLEISFLALVVLGLGGLAAASLFLKREAAGALELEFVFSGAERGLYPNNLPFSPEDLLDDAVVRQVYVRNNLARWLKYEEFKSGLSLNRGGTDLLMLRAEYQAKLDDRKLTAADRQRLEEEFAARTQGIPPVRYRLAWIREARPGRLLPKELLRRSLREIPRVWAEEAVRKKQVLLFAARIPGPARLDAGTDVLASFNELLERSRSLQLGLEELAKMPGVNLPTEQERPNLADLLLGLRILTEQTIPEIQLTLLTNVDSPEAADRVERSFQLQLRTREGRLEQAKGGVSSVLATYRDYLAGRPGSDFSGSGSAKADAATRGSALPLAGAGTSLQISDSFLNKLMDVTKGNEDGPYRTQMVERIRSARLEEVDEQSSFEETQKILQSVQRDLDNWRKATATRGERKAAGAPDLAQAARDLNGLIQGAERLRSMVAENHMNPQTALYRVTLPFDLQVASPLSSRNAGLALAVFVFLGLAATLVACWAHDQSTNAGRREK